MSAWTRAGAAAMCVSASVLLTGCGGSGAQPAPTTGASPTANATATATTPARPAFIATATPDVQEPATPCRLEDLQVVGSPGNGATAMMSSFLSIANLGASACSLPPPTSVSFLDPSDGRTLAASRLPNRVRDPVTIRPTQAIAEDGHGPPAGSGYIWMLWTWRGDQGPCAVYDPPLVTVVATFAEFELEAPAPIKFGVCEGTLGIMGFERVQPAD